jgi:hypothetical protein
MSMTYNQLKDAVMEFFGDTSRSRAATKSGLRGIADEIEILIESLGSDEADGHDDGDDGDD